MYVSRLDRPWDGTPFPTQGFLVQTPDQLQELGAWCRYVFIDVRRSVDTREPAADGVGILPKVRQVYPETTGLEEEVEAAAVARQGADELARHILDAARRGEPPAREEVIRAVEPIVQSLVRNPDAYFWMDALRRRDDYAYSHAISCSALAAALGRHMGFPQDELVQLAIGGMLMDVGKAWLPETLLRHAGPLDPAQWALVREHVGRGLHIVREGGLDSPIVVAMVEFHHEAFDGSGYTQGLAGDRIPLFGRMAAVIDAFDAMTSERAYAPALSRHDALQQLYRGARDRYQQEVVEQFTQCMGVYPTGSLVELSSGEVALVMSQNRVRQLRPRVMLLTGPDKRIDPAFRQIDLMEQAAAGDGSMIHIARALPPGACGIDPAELFL